MPDRFRVCPICRFEQPEAVMKVFWHQGCDMPWRTGHLARTCWSCHYVGPSKGFGLVLVDRPVSLEPHHQM